MFECEEAVIFQFTKTSFYTRLKKYFSPTQKQKKLYKRGLLFNIFFNFQLVIAVGFQFLLAFTKTEVNSHANE